MSTSTTTPLLAPRYLATTLGATSLIFLYAFETLAVTTVMATVTRDLDGRSWYSVAFSLTLASSVVGTVVGGLVADRRGARLPLLVAIGVFSSGLLLAGLAPTIGVFVLARFLQGIGGGAVTVSIYVLVAEVFDGIDQPRLFGLFSAAWIVPSMVGPLLAGVVADTVGWRWVFLGVLAVACGATALLLPALRARPPVERAAEPDGRRRLVLAVLVAGSVVSVDLAGRAETTTGHVIAGLGVVATLAALRPLLPAGTLRVARGLPAVIAVRGVLSAGYLAAEIYVPYLLQARYGAPPWLAGLALTVSALSWAAAAQVQGRLGERLSHARAFGVGAVLLTVGIAGQLLVAAVHPSGWWVAPFWLLAGAGMGISFPRTSVAVLTASAEEERGRNSAALTMCDTVAGATSIAVSGVLFAAAQGPADSGFVTVFAVCSALAGLGVVVAGRAVGSPGRTTPRAPSAPG